MVRLEVVGLLKWPPLERFEVVAGKEFALRSGDDVVWGIMDTLYRKLDGIRRSLHMWQG